MKVVQQQQSMGNVVQLAKKLSDKSRMEQVQNGIMSFQHPETQSFEAVGEVKTTADTFDKYLTYSVYPQKFKTISHHGYSNHPDK